jgi:hypothetical protein
MRLSIFSLLFICAGTLSAQVNYHVDYDFSTRINNTHSQFSNVIGFGMTYKKMTAKACLGYENWMVNGDQFKFDRSTAPYRYSPQAAVKTELWIGYSHAILKTGVNIGLDYGFRLYFPNQVEDSLSMTWDSHTGRLNDGLLITTINRSTLAQFSPYSEYNNIDGVLFRSLSEYYYITKMRMAHLLRVHVGYTYKSFQLKLFYMPYLIRFEYQNANYPEKTGSNYLFFHDVGASISYTLPKRIKEKGN